LARPAAPSAASGGAAPSAAAPSAATEAADSAVNQNVTITVVLKYSDRAGLESFVQSLGNQPASSRRFLTQQEFIARFSPTQASYDAVVDYLRSFGFTLVEGSANR